MQLTLIRHLSTEWNKKTWLQGKQDIEISPLTEMDHQTIINNQLALQKQAPFDFVLASTLKRTHQTANVYGYKAETEALLDELNFGPFEGKPKNELLNKCGSTWLENPKDLVLGEELVNLEERIVQFLAKYRESSNILVFGHGSWMRALKSYWKYGHINHMNKLSVGNNECIRLEFITVV
jgi:broad specificity phosphatase PhoE